MIVLGIESSCDETSAAILENGSIRASEIYSQKDHAAFGGVVPEIASRAHLEKIDPLCRAVFSHAGIAPSGLDLVAVTDSPGLAGALLVGVSFALGLHASYGTPLTGVNHLEGHICSALIEHPELGFPFLALVVSGGHTAIYRVDDIGRYDRICRTVDDAAGEAFDKVGKLLGFAYPAGRSVEETASLAPRPNPLSFPVARLRDGSLDFSFSGLKTAVKYYAGTLSASQVREQRPRICDAFQSAVVQSLAGHSRRAMELTGIRRMVLVGGVACNKALRGALAGVFGAGLFFPSPQLCTDNAAMIARAGFEKVKRAQGRFPRMSPVQEF